MTKTQRVEREKITNYYEEEGEEVEEDEVVDVKNVKLDYNIGWLLAVKLSLLKRRV